MTSFRPPDFDVSLSIPEQDFQAIGGIAFTAKIRFAMDHSPSSGMLLIPQGGQPLAQSGKVRGWLWCRNADSVGEGTEVAITLGRPCDPMLTGEDESLLQRFAETVLCGFIA